MVPGLQVRLRRRDPRADLRCSHRNNVFARRQGLIAQPVRFGAGVRQRGSPFRLRCRTRAPNPKHKENLLSASQSSTPKAKKDEETVTVSKAQLDALLARID